MAKIQAKIWWRSVKVCNAFWVAPKARSVFRQLMLITFNCFLSALSGTVQLINVAHTQRGTKHKLITLNATEINFVKARTKQLKPGRKAMLAEEPQRQHTLTDTHRFCHLHTQTHICQDKSTCQRTVEAGARRKWNCRSYCQKKSNNLNYVLQFVHPNLPTHTNKHSHPHSVPRSLSVSLPLFIFIREIIVCFVAASCFYYYAIYVSRTYAAFIFTAFYCGYYCILPASEVMEKFQNRF